jgi:hypothetical protein
LHPEDHTIDPHMFYQFFITHHHNLVGGWATPLKNMKSVGVIITIYGKS